MQIVLNGKDHTEEALSNVDALLDSLNIRGQRVAVMVNDAIVKKDKFDSTRLNDGDRVEVIQMVGGG